MKKLFRGTNGPRYGDGVKYKQSFILNVPPCKNRAKNSKIGIFFNITFSHIFIVK